MATPPTYDDEKREARGKDRIKIENISVYDTSCTLSLPPDVYVPQEVQQMQMLTVECSCRI